jgi:hypothetical protein
MFPSVAGAMRGLLAGWAGPHKRFLNLLQHRQIRDRQASGPMHAAGATERVWPSTVVMTWISRPRIRRTSFNTGAATASRCSPCRRCMLFEGRTPW